MPEQEVREWRVPPHRNLHSDATKTKGFYLLTRQVCEEHHAAIVESSAGAVRETRRDGLISWCLRFGETKPFQFDGGEHKQDRLSNGSNLQGGERHFNKSKLCHPTAPFLHHRKCFSQSTVRILGCLETWKALKSLSQKLQLSKYSHTVEGSTHLWIIILNVTTHGVPVIEPNCSLKAWIYCCFVAPEYQHLPHFHIIVSHDYIQQIYPPSCLSKKCASLFAAEHKTIYFEECWLAGQNWLNVPQKGRKDLQVCNNMS